MMYIGHDIILDVSWLTDESPRINPDWDGIIIIISSIQIIQHIAVNTSF